jgi:hypothetical protein
MLNKFGVRNSQPVFGDLGYTGDDRNGSRIRLKTKSQINRIPQSGRNGIASYSRSHLYCRFPVSDLSKDDWRARKYLVAVSLRELNRVRGDCDHEVQLHPGKFTPEGLRLAVLIEFPFCREVIVFQVCIIKSDRRWNPARQWNP